RTLLGHCNSPCSQLASKGRCKRWRIGRRVWLGGRDTRNVLSGRRAHRSSESFAKVALARSLHWICRFGSARNQHGWACRRSYRRSAPSECYEVTKTDLTVVPRDVVRSFWESRAGREGVQGGVRAMEVIVMKVGGKEGSSVGAGVIRTGIGPLAGDDLDEAFGLAVGLRAIGFGEEMFEA